MGRFFAFLFVFVLGGLIGLAVGGFGGAAAGAYVGACQVIDKSVADGTMTQEDANALVKSIANELDIKAERKQQIIDGLKKADAPPSACQTAIEAL
jgi:polyhydroxyalkanoate synthesis regulator phasin